VRRVRRAGPRSDRRRIDDVRAGEQRALPSQDLQRPDDRRRPASAAVAVPDDPAQHRRRARAGCCPPTATTPRSSKGTPAALQSRPEDRRLRRAGPGRRTS
jgi:hypothetical protein